jgi:hypothetical protein
MNSMVGVKSFVGLPRVVCIRCLMTCITMFAGQCDQGSHWFTLAELHREAYKYVTIVRECGFKSVRADDAVSCITPMFSVHVLWFVEVFRAYVVRCDVQAQLTQLVLHNPNEFSSQSDEADLLPEEEEDAEDAGPDVATDDYDEDPSDIDGLITHLSSVDLGDLYRTFRESAPNGTLDRPAFRRCFLRFFPQPHTSDADYGALQHRWVVGAILERVFAIFDRDHNGVVDYAEFVSGMSFLVSGNPLDKLKCMAALRGPGPGPGPGAGAGATPLDVLWRW